MIINASLTTTTTTATTTISTATTTATNTILTATTAATNTILTDTTAATNTILTDTAATANTISTATTTGTNTISTAMLSTIQNPACCQQGGSCDAGHTCCRVNTTNGIACGNECSIIKYIQFLDATQFAYNTFIKSILVHHFRMLFVTD